MAVPLMVAWGIAVTVGIRGNPDLRTVIVTAIAFRLLFVGTPPSLSDDLYRFLFEGAALNAGHNPFLVAPADLSGIDDWLQRRVNHAEVPSIYPPVAQAWFRLLALLGARPVVAQLCTGAIDVAVAGALFAVLRQRSRETWPALLYAAHPLAVVESAHGAHLEPLAMLCGLVTLMTLQKRPFVAGAAITAGIGVKLLPVLFLPAFFRRWSTLR